MVRFAVGGDRFRPSEDGLPVAVQIESADQSITMIRFDPSHENLPPGFRVC
jgi:hypothetical protein